MSKKLFDQAYFSFQKISCKNFPTLKVCYVLIFTSFYKSYDCDYFHSCSSLQTLSRIPSRASHFTPRPYFAPHSFSPYPNKKSVSFSLYLFLMSDINFHFSPLFQPSKSMITLTKSVLPTLTIFMTKK